jgi:hypothetical protein
MDYQLNTFIMSDFWWVLALFPSLPSGTRRRWEAITALCESSMQETIKRTMNMTTRTYLISINWLSSNFYPCFMLILSSIFRDGKRFKVEMNSEELAKCLPRHWMSVFILRWRWKIGLGSSFAKLVFWEFLCENRLNLIFELVDGWNETEMFADVYRRSFDFALITMLNCLEEECLFFQDSCFLVDWKWGGWDELPMRLADKLAGKLADEIHWWVSPSSFFC